MRIRPGLLGTLMGVILLVFAGSPLSGQGRGVGLQFEAGAAILIPARAPGESNLGSMRSKATPLLTGGIILRRGSTLSFRMRGGATLTAGAVTLIRSGSGSGRLAGSSGGTLLALGEVLIALMDKPDAELAVGVGARHYRFGQEGCAGICTGDRSNTGPTGSLSLSLGTRMGKLNVGLAAGTLVSSYRGRAMVDLLLGVRARF
jgi:hypothetical protein